MIILFIIIPSIENNVKANEVPDLQPVDIWTETNTPMQNDTVTVNCRIYDGNYTGIDELNGFYVAFYKNQEWFHTETFDETWDNHLAICSFLYNFSESGGTWGNTTIKVSVDFEEDVIEANESNNIMERTIFFIHDINPLNANTTIRDNKWTWLGYLNNYDKSSEQLYSEIPNCQWVVMQNITTGYYYTYGYCIKEEFTVILGSAVCIVTTTESYWNHK